MFFVSLYCWIPEPIKAENEKNTEWQVKMSQGLESGLGSYPDIQRQSETDTFQDVRV